MIRPRFIYGQRPVFRPALSTALVLQLLVICPPTISFALLSPELGVADINPTIAARALGPTAESKDINPIISTELLGPDVDSGGCC